MSHCEYHTPARSATDGGVRGGHWRRLALAVAVSAALGVSSLQAQADDYAEVNRLVRSGQLAEALAKADQYLSSRPRDPQMRFLRGVIQTESGRTSDAIATFLKLTEDFPELPEPYNNLAVLYASQSQFDKARVALEMAIRTNPSYATAHENLGDVYAKLASQAYSKALQLDGTNTGVAPKLSLIRNLFAADGRGAAAASQVAAAPAPSRPVAAAPAPAATPAPAPAPAPAATPAAGVAAVEASIDAWARAWSARNMGDYLAAYAPGFTPQGGQSRTAWEADRRARIVPRQRINVDVSDLTVSIDGDRATARFRQAYTSDTINVTSRKTLELVRSGDRWLIVRETTGS
ncbi:tetratricopeptide repeat protein [Hydrogenophaga sp.]|uniref:tetratricopeptide repeat protein n=1 Tax=Hydrogenophaga sp. TaxID=1904254 RepID=UPI002BC28FF4|nr:tetratricopeptide repeat protein [Hydrogenophaga sp.]HMP09121.1 tetratricopeptide repeat protein [Hydrogenophaga sp.]